MKTKITLLLIMLTPSIVFAVVGESYSQVARQYGSPDNLNRNNYSATWELYPNRELTVRFTSDTPRIAIEAVLRNPLQDSAISSNEINNFIRGQEERLQETPYRLLKTKWARKTAPDKHYNIYRTPDESVIAFYPIQVRSRHEVVIKRKPKDNED